MKTEWKNLPWFKSYGQFKIETEIRVIFLCILAQIFNELEGPLRMLGIRAKVATRVKPFYIRAGGKLIIS